MKMKTIEMIQYLTSFKNAYECILENWMSIDGEDLDDLDANSLYPFESSFDELNISQWVDETINELRLRNK